MKYLFYPGCSMHGAALEYQTSMLAVLKHVGAEVQELDDWTCCGASVASVVSDLLGLAMPARNLALAEKVGDGRELLVGCSACYTNFRRTAIAAQNPATLAKINQALEVENVTYRGTIRTRHLMDVLANDVGPQAIAERVKRPLTGLKVAPYYGCQTVRPYSPYDDSQHPDSMVGVLEALGVTVCHHSHEAICCGTALLTTKPKVGFGIAGAILEAASPADCIATVCPMCHMNLDSYQDKASNVLGKHLSIPVLFLPQLIGLAFGLPDDQLLLKRLVVPAAPVLAQIAQ
ncbi:MAG: CoB--CoM heterodisulfide reductase iron-sulfur subunit B family protein [Thermoflexales bacterium]|nr:CoB--CoM heterodisulfide reductase iron-sulfur subunit B family protein [Thermoflexales bacterium]